MGTRRGREEVVGNLRARPGLCRTVHKGRCGCSLGLGDIILLSSLLEDDRKSLANQGWDRRGVESGRESQISLNGSCGGQRMVRKTIKGRIPAPFYPPLA